MTPAEALSQVMDRAQRYLSTERAIGHQAAALGMMRERLPFDVSLTDEALEHGWSTERLAIETAHAYGIEERHRWDR